ncbi:hypothetical protein SAMN05216464_101118 [Mucilaginibacter pineti]|uniref:Uncharacterized protein n=1 Tax=Mucilaginibacter pineti TaxID=1391627 RepID=A0A1G6T198_9SPHI|nr:hypothetical protein SAMN05216464_101118 [Mucilaginibacter pineti]
MPYELFNKNVMPWFYIKFVINRPEFWKSIGF